MSYYSYYDCLHNAQENAALTLSQRGCCVVTRSQSDEVHLPGKYYSQEPLTIPWANRVFTLVPSQDAE